MPTRLLEATSVGGDDSPNCDTRSCRVPLAIQRRKIMFLCPMLCTVGVVIAQNKESTDVIVDCFFLCCYKHFVAKSHNFSFQ